MDKWQTILLFFLQLDFGNKNDAFDYFDIDYLVHVDVDKQNLYCTTSL